MKRLLLVGVLAAAVSAQAGTLTIDNGSGAASITHTSAVLGASITATNAMNPWLFLYWGLTNKTTNATQWQYTNAFGQSTQGTYTIQASNLAPATLYYYRTRGTDTTASAWANASVVFRTLSQPTSTPPASVQTVTVDTNGVLKNPTNFFSANNVFTNMTSYSNDLVQITYTNINLLSNNLCVLIGSASGNVAQLAFTNDWAVSNRLCAIVGTSSGNLAQITFTNDFSVSNNVKQLAYTNDWAVSNDVKQLAYTNDWAVSNNIVAMFVSSNSVEAMLGGTSNSLMKQITNGIVTWLPTAVLTAPTNGGPWWCWVHPWAVAGTLQEVVVSTMGSTGYVNVVRHNMTAGDGTYDIILTNLVVNATPASTVFARPATNKQEIGFLLSGLTDFTQTNTVTIRVRMTEP